MTDIFAGFLRAVSNLLRAANLPAEDWHLFINNMMSGVIPGWRTAPKPRPTEPNASTAATLVARLASLPSPQGHQVRRAPRGLARGGSHPADRHSARHLGRQGRGRAAGAADVAGGRAPRCHAAGRARREGALESRGLCWLLRTGVSVRCPCVPRRPNPLSARRHSAKRSVCRLNDGLTLTKRPYKCDCSWKARYSCPGEDRSGLMNRMFGKPAADDGSACFAYCCGGEDHAQEATNRTLRTRWPRPGDADVSEITAMSSAAAGAAASPTIVKAAFKSVFKDVLAVSRSSPLVSESTRITRDYPRLGEPQQPARLRPEGDAQGADDSGARGGEPRRALLHMHSRVQVFSMLDKRASDAPTEEEFRWWAAGKSDDAFLEKHIGEFVDECMPLGLHHLAVDVTLNRTEANRSRIVHS